MKRPPVVSPMVSVVWVASLARAFKRREARPGLSGTDTDVVQNRPAEEQPSDGDGRNQSGGHHVLYTLRRISNTGPVLRDGR